ncbi:MAG: carbohydrate ABC transporter permease [Clostridia bacterium]|nr:carbohydrate ABC transporter permease [Clostridia bacterium]
MKIFKKKKFEFSVSKILVFLFVLLWCATFLYCMGWGLITTFKTVREFVIQKNIMGFPKRWAFENYTEVWKLGFYVQVRGHIYANIYNMFFNSVVYATGCTVFAVFGKLITAYACAKYDFPLKKLLYAVAVVTMILPIVGAMPSTLKIMRLLGLYDTFIGCFLMNAGFHGLYFLLFYAAFASTSDTYMEAARMDGAGHLKIMIQIMIPLVWPTVVAVMLMLFISFWNGYEQPMMYMPSKPTISYGLYLLTLKTNNHFSEAPRQLAGAFIICAPILLVFILFKNKIMNNMSLGGIKG